MKSFTLFLILFILNSWLRGQPVYTLLDSGQVCRQPAFKACHAATLTELAPDTLLYAWFAGDYEGADNVCIWACYRYTGSKPQWGQPFILAEGRDSAGKPLACWNPVLFHTKKGLLLLDYKVGPPNGRPSAKSVLIMAGAGRRPYPCPAPTWDPSKTNPSNCPMGACSMPRAKKRKQAINGPSMPRSAMPAAANGNIYLSTATALP